MHRAYEEAGETGLQAAIRDLAEVLGAEVNLVEDNYKGLWEELKGSTGKKRGREGEQVSRKAGGLQVMLDLGDIISREVEARIALFNLKRAHTTPSLPKETPAEVTISGTAELLTKNSGIRIPQSQKELCEPEKETIAVDVPEGNKESGQPAVTSRPAYPLPAPQTPIPILNVPATAVTEPPIPTLPEPTSDVIDVEMPSPQPLKHISVVTNTGVSVSIPYVNEVDDTVLPSNWTFIAANDLGQTHISDLKQTCRCANLSICKDPRLCPCAQFNVKANISGLCHYTGTAPNKHITGFLSSSKASYLYECSDECQCKKDKCVLSFASQGLDKSTKRNLVVVRSKTVDPVWTVQTLEGIGKDEYVMEITGEVISKTDYLLREDPTLAYLAPGFYLDNRMNGNIGRFLSHCCAPALALVRVHTGHKDPKLTRLMLYSTRDIAAGEELTVNWEQLLCLEGRWKCECGGKDCKGYIGA